MSLLDLFSVRRHGTRFYQASRGPSWAAPLRSVMQLEWLEDRVALDAVTFAQFIHLGESPQVFAYTNNSGTSADFNTLPGGDAILLSFDARFAPGLTTPRNAHLFLTSHTTTPAILPVPPDNVTREHFPVAANTLQITLDTPVGGKTNFLTVTYSDLLGGRLSSHEASLRASDATMPPDVVTFTSDFINFTGTINHGFSLSFSSVNSDDGSGGLQPGAGDFFKSFTAAGTGTFDTNFSGQLGGEKFQDTNGNGRKDPGEPGLAGWRIFLDGNGIHRDTVTDANGNYKFANLDPGTYRVREENKPGWVQTTVNPGDITVVSGSDITGVDFGNFRLVTIGGQKFQDTNGNGVRDPGELGLAGWTIVLDAVGGNAHFSTVTDATGSYRFADLPPGTYRVREVGKAGWVQTTVNPGDITVASGSDITGVDFGNFQLVSIGGQKFQDSNGNGVRDPGEPGLAGWTIVLDAVGGNAHFSTVTDATGSYHFADLPPGTYRVREVGKPGWVQTTVNPGDITVVSGSAITGVDFGNFQLVSIGGHKFQDSNGNGVRDPGEPGLAGWTIVLDAVGGNAHFSTVTDATGSYRFADLPPGTYRVREVSKPGWVQTTANPADITVISGGNVTGVDFGNLLTPPSGILLPAFGVTGPLPAAPNMVSKLELFAPNLLGMQSGLLAAQVAFVGGLYQNVLGRPVDPAGLTYWVQVLLAGVSRQQVAMTIWRSPEHRGVEVDQFYTTFLQRGADAGGRASWVNSLLAGAGEADVIRGFLTSEEYQAAHRSDLAFVTGLYAQILGRPADPPGLSSWLQALQHGLSRQALAQAFLTSAEADRRVVDEYYTLFLNRRPDPGGEQLWTDSLLGGRATFESVGEALLASDEYFTHVAKA